MNRFKNLLIVAAVFALLTVIGTVLNTRRVASQGPPGGMAVNIVNPLPVPVTGATTVSGAVAATQSGAWNVGITGTPNVKVTNPVTAVGITGTPNVNVANTVATPVLTLDISKSASQHVELICNVAPSCSATSTCAALNGFRISLDIVVR
jgi:hypothetical protein